MGYGNFRESGSSSSSGDSRGGFRGGGFRSGGFRGGHSGGGFRRGGGFNRGPREMTEITCAKCGKKDQVPFKPRDGSTVLCKECYFKEKGIEPRAPRSEFSSEGNSAPKESVKKEDSMGMDDDFAESSAKEDEF
jgi:CxxC-x17-CxxC domain-containing protein